MKRMWSKNEVKGLSKDVIESGAVENAKPIYCHPITLGIQVDENNYLACTMLIFNNSATAFEWSTFKTWIGDLAQEITSARIMISGIMCVEGTIYPANYLFASVNTQRQFVSIPLYPNLPTSIVLDLTSVWNSITPYQFADGVNKIN